MSENIEIEYDDDGGDEDEADDEDDEDDNSLDLTVDYEQDFEDLQNEIKKIEKRKKAKIDRSISKMRDPVKKYHCILQCDEEVSQRLQVINCLLSFRNGLPETEAKLVERIMQIANQKVFDMFIYINNSYRIKVPRDDEFFEDYGNNIRMLMHHPRFQEVF